MNSSKNKLPTRKKSLPPPNSSDFKLPKIAKTEMPKDFKIRTQPLYSLPEEVLKLPDPNKKKKTRVIKEASVKKSNVMHSYTAMRKAREEFRVKLMSLICQENEGGDQDIPSGEEKNMMRYYYYLNYGVDTVHVAPLDNKMILKVHNLIPVKLKKWRDILLTCTDDMREDFMMSMKKAIVDFVLKDPNTEEAVDEEETPLKAELAKKDDAWRYRYIVAKKFLGKNLHSANPCIAQVLQIWCKQFLYV
ncbi:Dynein heavy chain 7, axonemal [Eumeta japonica]|uniref:Dynein heavy chain 7, axonemal n=1 Tax=Eumeta variegata TaxID=151549 RepID=A0A4C1SUK8_EUMVA|nr:Dynein heavy chain 7, axonemal [Eumeta japonica]